jgi:hypothetical protein
MCHEFPFHRGPSKTPLDGRVTSDGRQADRWSNQAASSVT